MGDKITVVSGAEGEGDNNNHLTTVTDDLNAVFDLDEQLLQEYPEMKALSGKLGKDVSDEVRTISAIYVNGRTIDTYIQDVLDNKSTGSIEYHLQLVEGMLSKLKNSEYQNFVSKESEKLTNRKKKATEAIGEKQRIDGVYTLPAAA